MKRRQSNASQSRLSLRLALMAGVIVATVSPPSPANANLFGYYPSDGLYFADNGSHNYFNNGLAAQNASAMDYAMMTRLQSTDMVVDEFESWNLDTDVVVWDDYYGSTISQGRWHCTRLVANSTTKCNQGYIEFNLTKGLATNALACHETGHSVALGHSADGDSCMQAIVPSVDNNYNPHDRAHINNYSGY